MNDLEKIFSLKDMECKRKVLNLGGRADLYDRNQNLLLSCQGKLLSFKQIYSVYNVHQELLFRISSRKFLGYDNFYYVADGATGQDIGILKGPPMPHVRTRRQPWNIFNREDVLVAAVTDKTFDSTMKFIAGLYGLSYEIQNTDGEILAKIQAFYHLFFRGFINHDLTLANDIKDSVDKRLILAAIFLIVICTR